MRVILTLDERTFSHRGTWRCINDERDDENVKNLADYNFNTLKGLGRGKMQLESMIFLFLIGFINILNLQIEEKKFMIL